MCAFSLWLHTHSPLSRLCIVFPQKGWRRSTIVKMIIIIIIWKEVWWMIQCSMVCYERESTVVLCCKWKKKEPKYMGLLVGINIGRDFSPSIQRTYTIGWNWGEQGYHHKYEEKISKMNPCLDSLWWNVWWCVIDQDTGQMVIVSLSSGKTTLWYSFQWYCIQTDGLLPLARHGGALRPVHLVMSHTG